MSKTDEAPLVSIVVAVYNVEEYLDRCLESALKQSYEPMEIVVVNDGSSDSSGEICDKFALKSNKIKVLHKKNGGLVSARKAGLAVAKGKYIGFLDGDDYIDKDMFKSLAENIEETCADFVHSGYWTNGRKVSCFENKVIELNNSEDKVSFIKKYLLNERNRISPSIVTKLFQAELIRKCYNMVPDAQEVGEDLLNLTQCVLQSEKISLLNAAGYHYMMREGSLSNLRGVEGLMWQTDLYLGLKDILTKHACYEQVKKWLDCYFLATVWHSLEKRFENQLLMTRYLFKNAEFVTNKRIILYGAGEVGRDYYAQLSCCPGCKIVAWIDRNYQSIHYDDCMKVTGMESLKVFEYDYIIIAVNNKKQADEIKMMLEKYGIDFGKLIYSDPVDVCYSGI